jgi:hypothetical protein
MGLVSRNLGCAMIETIEPWIWFSFEQKGIVFNLTEVRKNYVRGKDNSMPIAIRIWPCIKEIPCYHKEFRRCLTTYNIISFLCL